MKYQIDKLTPKDWGQIIRIYLEGIKTGNATFEVEVPGFRKWDRSHIPNCRIVARYNDVILGYAVLSPVSSRCVYRGVAEVSIYIGEEYRRKGVGKQLLEKLISLSESKGYWTLQAGIFPENIASIKLHKKCGFREVGRREKIGKMKDGRWRDVILMERRSKITGTYIISS
ncbi:N-acetyltransferase [Candidatus Gottesmanbacteria bacterium CG11_big_fil_rev_8_21_14_0_20_37_11]|uniref:N-acetyltransferase n=3 Tax=Candidatus Gottesmaniibacteriota TaxID=1752720 RepID=A0A2M7RSC8_9BACT|nr:MAG: N-acetyltransferase [Candidatus Gottesmanbacteria bacterium CG1_02_37_22]PIP32913.1 MAG: N-acetyltransferase [Candidatus Gottesmanbacteria bacterium CG23_combo_of_CG06-09_8_20_14_all_37_19]PIR07953.1 MAG: N-acetyltransferase [Candidatus Gottesmanbacteria bacterium CG11_big_fil_rev_8_21_14_0_20_37_11]PIZ03228.1 MAG: N-acetyltransferase [Candidatus Gottesmanbacteria bacterium CG_4_10_14_0_8_um_filter_37_24]